MSERPSIVWAQVVPGRYEGACRWAGEVWEAVCVVVSTSDHGFAGAKGWKVFVLPAGVRGVAEERAVAPTLNRAKVAAVERIMASAEARAKGVPVGGGEVKAGWVDPEVWADEHD